MRRSDQEGSYAPEIGFRSGIPSHRDAREGRGTDVGPDSRGTEQRHGQPGATTGPPAHRRAATTRRQRIRGPRNTGCPGGSFEANFATARRKVKSRPVCNAKYGPARHYRRAGAAGLRPALPRRRPPAAPLAGNDRCDRSAASRWDGWSSTMATVAVRAATPTSVAPLSGTRLPFSGCSVFCGPPKSLRALSNRSSVRSLRFVDGRRHSRTSLARRLHVGLQLGRRHGTAAGAQAGVDSLRPE